MNVVALILGEHIAAAAYVIGGFQALHQGHNPLLDFVGELNKLGGLIQALQLFSRRAAEVGGGIKLMENPPKQVKVIPHHNDGRFNLFNVAAVRLGVVCQCQVHLLLDANVVNDQAFLLVLELSVHPRDGLDKVVALNRLVYVDGIQEGHIEARQPHVYYYGDLEVRFRLLELSVEVLAVVLVAQQIVERLFVILAPRHHHLDALHGEDFFLLLLG